MADLLPTEFVISGCCQGAAATMELHGELDLAVAEHVLAEFDKLLVSDPAAVIVDLREVSFIDVSGMRVLIALRIRCEDQARRLVLVRGQPAVHRLLALCSLERTFEFVDSVAEAVELTSLYRCAPDHGGIAEREPFARWPSGPDEQLLARRTPRSSAGLG